MHDDGDGDQEDLNGWASKDLKNSNGDQEDLNGWASKDLQNSNGGWAHDDAWETSAPSQTQMPPQPPAKDGFHTKSQKRQHQQHQHQHPHQQQPQSSNGWGNGGGAWNGNQGAPAPAKHQNSKLSQTTQHAMAPAWSTWSHEAGRGQGRDIEEIEEEEEEEEWSSAEEDPWGQPATGWNQQQPTHAPQAYAQHQPSQQSSWQMWGEEARRLPKVTFDSAITSSPSSTEARHPFLSCGDSGFKNVT